jgi:riboflavin synthase
MFTGIVTDVGRVRAIVPNGTTRIELETRYDTEGIELGASISCDGACLSVVEKGRGWFAIQASHETLSRTTLGTWVPGRAVNLERALRAGDELGGHLVSGHVDGIGTIADLRQDGGSLRVTIEVPQPLARFIAPKGSIAVDGVSLTVNEVEGRRFGVNLIPITLERTNLGERTQGGQVNLEIDLVARYLARLLEGQTP